MIAPRPRGEDFLRRQAQGTRAEAAIRAWVADSPVYMPLSYGISDGTPFTPGDAWDQYYQAHREREEQGMKGLKRPDYLVVKREFPDQSKLALEVKFSNYNNPRNNCLKMKKEEVEPLWLWQRHSNVPLVITTTFQEDTWAMSMDRFLWCYDHPELTKSYTFTPPSTGKETVMVPCTQALFVLRGKQILLSIDQIVLKFWPTTEVVHRV